MANTLDLFNQFKTIFCLCPHCSSLLRLSQLRLRSDAPTPKTWLDEYELQERKLEKQEEKVSEKEYEQEEVIKKKREKATQRGRSKVVSMVLGTLDSTSSRLLKKYNPFDVKPIIHPVDFVIFNGDYEAKKTKYREKSIKEVVFFSKKSENSDMLNLQKSVDECVKRKNYDFKLARISNEGKVTFE
jgi:predicted Holliday junction resolvase-like endonuclease